MVVDVPTVVPSVVAPVVVSGAPVVDDATVLVETVVGGWKQATMTRRRSVGALETNHLQ